MLVLPATSMEMMSSALASSREARMVLTRLLVSGGLDAKIEEGGGVTAASETRVGLSAGDPSLNAE
jgi:hypothetical protein